MRRLLASIATSTLALGSLLVAAAPASAHTPDVTATCDGLDVELRYYDGARVTVTVDDEILDDAGFTSRYAASFDHDGSVAHTWHVAVDAHDDDQWDREWSGQTTPCAAEAAPEERLVTGLYLYEKVHPDQPAAWHNSGPQELLVQRDGHSFWDEEDFPVENLPADVCGTGWGVQQDVADVSDGFEIPTRIVWPDGGFAGHLVDWRHDDLDDLVTVPPCDVAEPVTLPEPAPVEACDTEGRVELPESELAEYSVTWADDRSRATVTATPGADVLLADGAATSWTFEFSRTGCDDDGPVVVVPEPPTPVDLCGTAGDELVAPRDGVEVTYTTTDEGVVAEAAEGSTFGELPEGYTAVDATTALYPRDLVTFTDATCAPEPRDVTAVCEAGEPVLVYDVALPEGAQPEDAKPLTVTFLAQDGSAVELTDQPLAGRLAWPGQTPGDTLRVSFGAGPGEPAVVDVTPPSEGCGTPSGGGDEADGPVPVADGTPDAELPRTGAAVGIAVTVAALLVAAGASLFLVRRRLRQG
ncbi:LPXTG cell wall anchor domain-containing protein [Isoptericola sp. b515]|uniref:LPXTG cell wall anchor domain-containing protein n=1 Tax=Isoptericola sp. b515 TaxID=3064652 RepID=UPI00271410F4|nr:LPXTG cell wall anchor domain-containing protein [Isoptericola sp. b515]MDO8149795.1 LPXTG cell wall anchor domain-containing protein [Isoptericola sp. b515]